MEYQYGEENVYITSLGDLFDELEDQGLIELLYSFPKELNRLSEDDLELKFGPLYAEISPYSDVFDALDELEGQGYFIPPHLHRLYRIARDFVDEFESVLSTGQKDEVLDDMISCDTSIKTFKPYTAFDMSALYRFLVDEHVVVGVDEKQFADCINQANIKPLWETTGSKNFFKLFLHTLKKYYQDTYQQRRKDNPKWFIECCNSIDKTTEYMGKMNFPKTDTKVKFCENMELCIKQ